MVEALALFLICLLCLPVTLLVPAGLIGLLTSAVMQDFSIVLWIAIGSYIGGVSICGFTLTGLKLLPVKELAEPKSSSGSMALPGLFEEIVPLLLTALVGLIAGDVFALCLHLARVPLIATSIVPVTSGSLLTVALSSLLTIVYLYFVRWDSVEPGDLHQSTVIQSKWLSRLIITGVVLYLPLAALVSAWAGAWLTIVLARTVPIS